MVSGMAWISFPNSPGIKMSMDCGFNMTSDQAKKEISLCHTSKYINRSNQKLAQTAPRGNFVSSFRVVLHVKSVLILMRFHSLKHIRTICFDIHKTSMPRLYVCKETWMSLGIYGGHLCNLNMWFVVTFGHFFEEICP